LILYRQVRRLALFAGVALMCFAAPARYSLNGLVIAVDGARGTVTISHDAIAGYMDAMTMAFRVRDVAETSRVHPGDRASFTLVVDRQSSWVENLRVIPFESPARDPALASRLRLLDSVVGKAPAASIGIGQAVPDFTLTDQGNRPVSLSGFRGKVVALNFIYTRCPLPDYCFRLSNNFGRLQKRFSSRKDLMLLTVTFDPVHDRPDVLARYARTWKADPSMWRFLTGALPDIDRVCEMFGVARWQDDGLFTHSLHTVVIDRAGKVVANIEGNTFTAGQLGDLVEAALAGRR